MTDDMLREDESLTVLGRRSLVEKIRTKERRLPKTQYTAMAESTPKKPRTSEDFYLFCKFILEYEKYDASDKEESQDIVQNHEDEDEKTDSISNSTHPDDHENSVAEISSSDYFDESGDASSETEEDEEEEDDNYDLVTCFCGKPFAGRPMIECSKCLTWIHLKCARVQRSKIPDVFICSKCKDDGKKKE